MNNYICRYRNPYGNINNVTVDRISAVDTGFWINADYEHTTGSDCKYWIPPNRIICVEKIELPV